MYLKNASEPDLSYTVVSSTTFSNNPIWIRILPIIITMRSRLWLRRFLPNINQRYGALRHRPAEQDFEPKGSVQASSFAGRLVAQHPKGADRRADA